MQKMKIESENEKEGEEEGDEEKKNKYPDRPGEPNCLYYLKTGLCGYGANCRFNHPPLETTQDRTELPQREQSECEIGKWKLKPIVRISQYYIKTGTCKYGSSCKYNHPPDRHRSTTHVRLNTLGLPIRQEEKSCPYYMRNYTCKFGPACKFNHPNFPSSMPTMGSFLPSNFFPYHSTFQTWSVTKSLYLGSLRPPFTPTYVPLGYPSLPGHVVAQSWNGYLGNMNPISPPNFITPNNRGELAPNGQLDMWTMSIPRLPERPGQPQCRYFMSTGSCKYGSNCKFDHPKERVVRVEMNCLGPHGLPLRPREEICGDYRSYGICKYGPLCKFNHPFGYIGGWYFGITPQPMEDNFSLPNNNTNPAIANSSDTPQSKSSKITDWIQKPDSVEETDQQNTDVNVVDNSNELPRD